MLESTRRSSVLGMGQNLLPTKFSFAGIHILVGIWYRRFAAQLLPAVKQQGSRLGALSKDS